MKALKGKITHSELVIVRDHGTVIEMTCGEAVAVSQRIGEETLPEAGPLFDLIREHTRVLDNDRAGCTYILIKIVAPQPTIDDNPFEGQGMVRA